MKGLRGMTADLKEEWYAFELEEFPPACAGRMAEGMSWEQTDAVAAACISAFLASGPLDKECLELLDSAITRLTEMVAAAESDNRPYFEKLLEIARKVREASVN